jgi:polyhydroxybutyrate depolymerase
VASGWASVRLGAGLGPTLLLVEAAACWVPPGLPTPPQPTDAQLLAQRPYELLSPLDADGGAVDAGPAGWPLVLVLHGFHSTPRETAAYLFGADAEAVLRRSFVALPPGTMIQGGLAWMPVTPPAPPWDSAYLRAVLLDALSRAPIDPGRVYVVGYSQGAHMAHRVGCDSADLVSAAVAIAGQLQDCAPVRPVSVATVHGTLDSAIPYAGTLGAVDTISVWGRVDGCTGALASTGQTMHLTTATAAETTVQAFSGCPAGVGVELWTMSGVGHVPEWSSAFAPAILGFLDAHPRP